MWKVFWVESNPSSTVMVAITESTNKGGNENVAWFVFGLKEVAIANVIETWGSSPRPVGSIMAINSDHDIIGSVSGGCVENFVFDKALEIIKEN